jgi:hypothetical protein
MRPIQYCGAWHSVSASGRADKHHRAGHLSATVIHLIDERTFADASKR